MEEAIQQQPQDDIPIRRDSFQPQEPEITRYLLQAENVIKDKMNKYRGYIEIGGETGQAKDYIPPLNELGLAYIERAFNTFLNKNSILANLSKDQVSTFVLKFAKNVRMNLIENRRLFKITSPTCFREIKPDICDMAFLVLSQSIDDKGRNYINEGRSSREIHNYTQQGQNKKFMM